MIDATLVQTPFRPGRQGEAEEEADPPVDADADLTARKGRRGTHYGYKAHAGVDVETRLIRRLILTPANVNETVVADALVCGDERAVYADKAYAKRRGATGCAHSRSRPASCTRAGAAGRRSSPPSSATTR